MAFCWFSVKFPVCVNAILSSGPPLPTLRGSSFVDAKNPLALSESTHTCNVALDATLDAGMLARSCVLLMNWVDRKFPGNTATVSPLAKPVPFTVSVKVEAPAETLLGLMLVKVRRAGTVAAKAAEGTPPGFLAVIETGPGV